MVHMLMSQAVPDMLGQRLKSMREYKSPTYMWLFPSYYVSSTGKRCWPETCYTRHAANLLANWTQTLCNNRLIKDMLKVTYRELLPTAACIPARCKCQHWYEIW